MAVPEAVRSVAGYPYNYYAGSCASSVATSGGREDAWWESIFYCSFVA